MNDSLFEILMSFFETNFAALKKGLFALEVSATSSLDMLKNNDDNKHFKKNSSKQSVRVFSFEEQLKLTKASYQLLVQILIQRSIEPFLFERIMQQLMQSESRFITLAETKWVIQNHLSDTHKNFSLLNLMLYSDQNGLVH